MTQHPHHITTIANPDGDGRVAVTIAGISHEPEWVPDARVVVGGYWSDTAWVRYEEGEREGLTSRVRFSKLRHTPTEGRSSRPLA